MKGISIVVCTHNGVNRIESALASLFRLKHPSGTAHEIIVVDNASTDGTAASCTAYARRTGYQGAFLVVSEPQAGLNFARLKGLFTATFDWILFCDDDNELFPDYLVESVRIIGSTEGLGALGGVGIPRFEVAAPDWFERYSHSYAVGPQASEDGLVGEQPAELYGAGCLFYKPALMRWFENGFATVMTDRKGGQLVSGGDVEWCYLVQLSGYSLGYNRSLQFYHYMPAARLQWNYYLKLKAGIASGSARLIAYHVFFRYKTSMPRVVQFVRQFMSGCLKATTQWLLFELKKFFLPGKYSREVAKVGRVVLYNRMRSFWRDGFVALNHFRQLQKIR